MLRSVLNSTSSKGTLPIRSGRNQRAPGSPGLFFRGGGEREVGLPATWTSQRPSSLPLGSGRYLAGGCSIEKTDHQLGLLTPHAVSRDKSRETTIHFFCTINTLNNLLLQTLTVLSIPTRMAWCSLRVHPAEHEKDPARARRADNARTGSI